MYTVTEGRTNVPTVGSCLRLTLIWGSTFVVFTLVQSRSLRKHCWKRFTNLEELKPSDTCWRWYSEVTWLTFNICQKKLNDIGNLKIHLLATQMCAAVYMQHAVNEQCSCTIYELVSHQLMHADYKRFCCGLCGRYFKRKGTCKALFLWDILIKWDFTMCNIQRRHFAPWFFNRIRRYISSVLSYLLTYVSLSPKWPILCRVGC